MENKQPTAYRQEMDALHVPEDKARETLRLMLEENRRLQEKKEKRPLSRRTVLLALAALAVVLALGIRLMPDRSDFAAVRMNGLPLSASLRGESDDAVPFSEAFGMTAEALFPGAQIADEKTVSLMLDDQTRHEATLRLTAAGKPLTVTVTDYEAPLYTVLQGKEKPILFARDPDTGRLYGVYREGSLYVVACGESMTEKDFSAAVEGLKHGQ